MKRLLILLFSACMLCGCSDDATTMFSNREYVYCYFDALQYTELFQVMGNYGQYASIRKHVVDGVTKVTMKNSSSSTDYNIDALNKNFGFGLGGLIVGTNYSGETLCYDLACPICDRADRRLTLSNDGYAKCGKCGVTFDLNNYGVIYNVPENADLTVRRGLYRYHLEYTIDYVTGTQIVNAHN